MISALPDDALVLETERLWLTPMVAEDEDIAQALLCNPRVMRYVAGSMTPEAVSEHMADAVKRGAGGRIGIWTAKRKDTGEKIGDCVLTPLPIDKDDTDWNEVVPDAYPSGQVEVGYLLIPSAWGQGFATEMCARVLRFAFELTNLPVVVAVTDKDNAHSQHVLKKCGLRLTGHHRAYAEDALPWFEITRAEWNAEFNP